MKILSRMTSLLSTVALITLSGCMGGGGGGGGYAPIPSPMTMNNPVPPLDPCSSFRNDGRNASNYLTEEYCRMKELGRLGVSTAYSNGYTGDGVTVAVIDSGVDMNNYDIKGNSLTSSAISYAGYHYDTDSDSVKETVDGVTSDQIEKINLSSGGSGYTTAPTITISGDGSGAKAIALLDGNGVVSGIYMTDRGSGYTNVTFSIDNNGTDGNGATIDSFYMGGYDDYGHGTSIAGIIAGTKDQADVNSTYDGFSMQGVAYNADILAIKVLDKSGNGMAWQIEKGVDYAVNKGAQVINMSLGTTDANAFDKQSFEDAVTANSTIVIASGNQGLDCLAVNGSLDGQCSFPAALPWLDGNSGMLDGDGGWIVVGSVDANNNLSSFSNKAGVTKDHYLVAPGEGVLSPSVDDTQTYNTGTSFAAPFVSGAMALMIEKYPHLKGKDVAQIFFDTAQDLGTAGIDDVYGNGLIDVYAAFAPIGSLGIVSQSVGGVVSNVSKVTVSSTSLNLSGVVGASLVSSQALEQTVAFDDWGRDFNVDMTNAISIDSRKVFSFDNYFTMNYGDLIIGFDQLRESAAIGYRLSKNNKVMFSFDKTLFGSSGDGSLGFDNSITYYGALMGGTNIDEDLRLAYELDYGYGKASPTENSLISNISNIHAMGGSLKGYYKNFGLGYRIPLTTVSGDMTLSVPVSRNIDGTINYLTSDENMRNDNYEQEYSVFYELNSKTYKLFLSYNLIKNYGGVYSDSLYKNVVFNYNYFF